MQKKIILIFAFFLVFFISVYANSTVTDFKVLLGTYDPDTKTLAPTGGKGFHLDEWYNKDSTFLLRILDTKTRKQITIGKVVVTSNTTLEVFEAAYKGSREPTYPEGTTIMNNHTVWNMWSYADSKIDAIVDIETEAGDSTPEAMNIFNIRITAGKDAVVKKILESYYASPDSGGTTPPDGTVPPGGKTGYYSFGFSDDAIKTLKSKGINADYEYIFNNNMTVTAQPLAMPASFEDFKKTTNGVAVYLAKDSSGKINGYKLGTIKPGKYYFTFWFKGFKPLTPTLTLEAGDIKYE